MSKLLTLDLMRKMCKGKMTASAAKNMEQLYVAIEQYGDQLGITQPQILPHFLAQQMHESGSFKYDKEIWGPTAAQKRYEGRKDLGNTQKGDGKRFMGRTGGQITGRYNYGKYTKWAKQLDSNAPDFTKNPELINTDPWEGLGPIWYWDSGNPEGKSLNKYAKDNNIEMITLRINGGKNGLGDRMDYYVRCALVLLGYGPTEITAFQKDQGFKKEDIDGIAGAQTRHALHTALGGKNPFKEVVKVEKPKAVEVPKPVVPDQVKQPWYTQPDQIVQNVSGPAGVTLFGFLNDLPWEKMLILLGIALVVVAIILFVKSRAKKQVAERTDVIEAKAQDKLAQIKDQRAEAEIEFKEAEA